MLLLLIRSTTLALVLTMALTVVGGRELGRPVSRRQTRNTVYISRYPASHVGESARARPVGEWIVFRGRTIICDDGALVAVLEIVLALLGVALSGVSWSMSSSNR